MTFFERLKNRMNEIDSRLCVGIDPHNTSVEKLLDECIALANQTAPHAACFKVNSAFFERHGSKGIEVLEELIPILQKIAPVILDSKRGDIGSTACAYAEASRRMGVKCMTVNPYMGLDSIEPFLQGDANIFVLCHTSNPSAPTVQHASHLETPLYLWLAEKLSKRPESLGFVVGTTHPDVIAKVRQSAPESWLLCPGVGKQGGSLEDAIKDGWGHNGNILIAVSRSIADAKDPGDEARQLKERIRRAQPRWADPFVQVLARDLAECVSFGDFLLKSSEISNVYLDLRKLSGMPDTFHAAGVVLSSIVQQINPQGIAGIPLGGLPLATAAALYSELPLCYPRQPKAHGLEKKIEGGVDEHEIVLIDDVITSGESLLEVLPILREKYVVNHMIVLVDRGVAKEKLEQWGIQLHCVFTLDELLEFWQLEGLVSHVSGNW